jgi:hypothetical protein
MIYKKKGRKTTTQSTIDEPTPVSEPKAQFICGRDQKCEVNMKNVLPPSSTLTNMQILDIEHAKDIDECLLKKQKRVNLNLKDHFVLRCKR